MEEHKKEHIIDSNHFYKSEVRNRLASTPQEMQKFIEENKLNLDPEIMKDLLKFEEKRRKK
jgi:hypothetical protein